MTILVTGCAGFIGSHLCERLVAEGHDIAGVDNLNPFYDPEVKRANLFEVEAAARRHERDFAFYAADIRHQRDMRDVLAEHRPTAVVHLAAMAGVRPSIEDPRLYEEVNQLGTVNLLEECRRAGVVNFLFASSSSVYGDASHLPFREDDPVAEPVSPYAATKRAGELMCRVYHGLYGLNAACLRFFTVYGPRQRPDLSIHKFTRLMHEGKRLPVFGDGTKKRDFTCIDDVCDGSLLAFRRLLTAPSPRFEIFNLGEDRPVSVNELIAALERATGLKAEIERLPDAPGDVRLTAADLSKSREVLGYAPKITLEDGLPPFVAWFRKACLG